MYNNGDPESECEVVALPPHDEPAEWFLLACLLHKPSVIPAIDREVLYVNTARNCLDAMKQAWSMHLLCLDNPHAFSHFVQRKVSAEVHGRLETAMDELPSADGWDYWHGVVMDCYKARCLEQLKPRISAVSQQVARGGSPNEVLFELQKISRLWHGSKTKTAAEVMPEVQEFLEYSLTHEGKYPGEITGFHRFDRLVCGLQPGKQYIIGGRPGHGKTSLVACMAIGLARRGTAVGFVSLEMLRVEIFGRMVSSESRVPLVNFLRGTATDAHIQQAAIFMQQIRELPISITDQLRNLSEVVMAMHEHAAKGAKVLIVDYLQKIVIPKFKGNRNELVTEISGAMKDMAMSLELPVVCCAQLNRESQKEDREPTTADLRDSGAVEQDADFVGLLYNKGKAPDPEYDGGEAVDLIIGKNRSGEEGRSAMTFRKDIFRFDEI